MPRWWNFNHTVALGVIVLGAALLASVPGQVAPPKALFGRQLTALDPALYPRLVLGAALVLGLWYFGLAARLRETNLLAQVGASGFFSVGVTLACLLVYPVALQRLGFVASGTAVMLVLSVFYGNRNAVQVVAVSLLVPAAIYYGLTRLMLISLPEFPYF